MRGIKMKAIGLTVYGFRIQNELNASIDLNVLPNGLSIIQTIQNFAATLTNHTTDDNDETIFSFERTDIQTVCNNAGQQSYRILYGRIKTGEYGIESELVDKDTGDVTHNRTANEAERMPFGFCIAIPVGRVDNGIILVQSIGALGVKGVLHKNLQACVKNIDNKLRLTMGTIVPLTYIDRFFNNAKLQKIRMIRYEIPHNVSDMYGINYGVQQTFEERTIFRPIGFIERKRREIDEWIRGQRSFTQVIEVEDFQYDDLKLEFKLGRTNKTFSLKNIDKLIVTEDVTDNVDTVGGHPTYDSLNNVMKTTAEEYLIEKGLIERE